MKGAAAASLAGLLAGLALGWQLWRPRPVVETPAPEIFQKDSSLILERRPDPGARPAHVIPRGAIVERVATVTVQPEIRDETRPTSVDSASTGRQPDPEIQRCSCAPVHVDLSLVRLADGTRRVIASARGGTVLGGVDVPVESTAPTRVLRWSVGPMLEQVIPSRLDRPPATAVGAFIDRDLERVAFVRLPTRVSAHVTRSPDEWRVGVRVGVRW